MERSKNHLRLCLESETIRPVIWHPLARKVVQGLSDEARNSLGQALLLLQFGKSLSMPESRPMPQVAPGVEELRIKDRSGSYRAFYLKQYAAGILVFHVFQKKTQETPRHEIQLGRKRLKEIAI